MTASFRRLSSDVTIYVTTMKADYRLAKGLIASIEAFSPSRNIVVLPDDDYTDAKIFGYPVWRPKDPRVLALNGYYKKLRIFWGPAERFIHCDADQMALRDIGPLLDHVAAQQAPFFAVNRSSRVRREWDAPEKRRSMCLSQAGDPALLAEFDPAYDLMAHMPFNSGEFSASRDAVQRDHMLEVFERAQAHHAARFPGAPMTFSRVGMFMSDQGFLNYYLRRWSRDVDFQWVDDLYWWGGNRESLAAQATPGNSMEGMLIHWAGCRRPGPIPLWFSPPHARDWRKHYRTYCFTRRDWRGFFYDAVDYVSHSMQEAISSFKRLVMRAYATGFTGAFGGRWSR